MIGKQNSKQALCTSFIQNASTFDLFTLNMCLIASIGFLVLQTRSISRVYTLNSMIYLQAIILIDDPITSKVEMIQQNNEHTMGLIITFC